MVTGFLCIWMERNMRGIEQWINSMERVVRSGRMVLFMKVIIKMEKNRVIFIFIKRIHFFFKKGQGVFTWVNGNCYTGSFVEGMIEGNGTFKWANG